LPVYRTIRVDAASAPEPELLVGVGLVMLDA
jgi:hypothetical protein